MAACKERFWGGRTCSDIRPLCSVIWGFASCSSRVLCAFYCISVFPCEYTIPICTSGKFLGYRLPIASHLQKSLLPYNQIRLVQHLWVFIFVFIFTCKVVLPSPLWPEILSFFKDLVCSWTLIHVSGLAWVSSTIVLHNPVAPNTLGYAVKQFSLYFISDNGEETQETELCTKWRHFCSVRVFDCDNTELWIFKVQLIEVLFHLIYSRWFSATTQRLR